MLKEIGLTQTGSTPPMSHKEYYGDFLPFVKPPEIDFDKKGGIYYEAQKLSEIGVRHARVFDKESIFMVCIGSIGKLGISNRMVSCNQQINVLTPYDNIINKYVYYAMLNPIFIEEVSKIAKSAQATLPIISKGKWEKLSIPVPPLSEQAEIVSRLDKSFEQIDTLRRNAEQSLTTAQQLFQSTLSHLLTPQPHWDRKVVGKIKDICTKGSSNLKQKDLLNDGKYAVYGASGIAGYLNEYHQPSEYIGIVKDGSGIGRVDFYPKETSLIGTMQYILPLDGFNIRYVGYCLQSLDLVKFKQGAAIPHIYFRDYGEMTIDVNNNIEEQAEIVARLDSLSAKVKQLKDNHTRTVALCEEMKQALLKEVFE